MVISNNLDAKDLCTLAKIKMKNKMKTGEILFTLFATALAVGTVAYIVKVKNARNTQ
jgi:hypothetical protein